MSCMKELVSCAKRKMRSTPNSTKSELYPNLYEKFDDHSTERFFQIRSCTWTIGCILSRRSTSGSRQSVRDQKRRPIACPVKSGDANGTDTVGDGTSADTRHPRRCRGSRRSAPALRRPAWSTRGSSPTITTATDSVSLGSADPRIPTATCRGTSPNEVCSSHKNDNNNDFMMRDVACGDCVN